MSHLAPSQEVECECTRFECSGFEAKLTHFVNLHQGVLTTSVLAAQNKVNPTFTI